MPRQMYSLLQVHFQTFRSVCCPITLLISWHYSITFYDSVYYLLLTVICDFFIAVTDVQVHPRRLDTVLSSSADGTVRSFDSNNSRAAVVLMVLTAVPVQ